MSEIDWSKAPEGLPSVEYLRQRLSYDPVTGSLTWLDRSESDFKMKNHYASWVSRCKGKEAGVVVPKKDKFYRRLHVSGSKMYAHRVAWAIYYGEHPDREIDHINGDSLDNSIKNLRLASRKENCRNVRLLDSNKSGHCGVSWHAETKKWRARVKVDGREKYIGLFDDPEEAAVQVRKLRDDLGFHPNHGKQGEAK